MKRLFASNWISPVMVKSGKSMSTHLTVVKWLFRVSIRKKTWQHNHTNPKHSATRTTPKVVVLHVYACQAYTHVWKRACVSTAKELCLDLKKGGPHLWDGGEVPEQVGGADGELLAVQGQVLAGLLAQVTEVLRSVEVEQGDAGLRVQLELEGGRTHARTLIYHFVILFLHSTDFKKIYIPLQCDTVEDVSKLGKTTIVISRIYAWRWNTDVNR